jgi:hypothetical protein
MKFTDRDLAVIRIAMSHFAYNCNLPKVLYPEQMHAARLCHMFDVADRTMTDVKPSTAYTDKIKFT